MQMAGLNKENRMKNREKTKRLNVQQGTVTMGLESILLHS